jgi:nitrogenase molybdenum-cofactor synthesis protein NifE
MVNILEKRKPQVFENGKDSHELSCEKKSLAGSVSQRACVFCGSRVVLYPIADALHLIHGPIGCAAYTWDIRGALSSGPELHRLSFSTDLCEKDVIYGGENKLYASLTELIRDHQPKAAFVYSTCIVGLIGDDVEAVCRKVAAESGIPVIPVQSEGFRGTKKDGYKAACVAVFQLVGTGGSEGTIPKSINILGDFNVAGETWIIKSYYRKMGVKVLSCITGDGRVDEIRASHHAALNVVQCSGSMTHLAKMMLEKYGIPYVRVSYFGIEDMAGALYDVAKFLNYPDIQKKTEELVKDEVTKILPEMERYRKALAGKKAAIYVGGAFKAFSLVKALRHIGMTTSVVGSQTGNQDDYNYLKEICDPGTVIVDDTNPLELSKFIREKGVDLLIGGVKERPIAYKMGIGFCDHNHERKTPLAGFSGMVNFCREVYSSVMSPVWKYAAASPRPSSAPLQIWRGDWGEAARTHVSARNACKLCSPLGAVFVYKGIENCVPLVHGSQGCSTYIRRYIISHYREPLDVASTNFSEESAIFGGGENMEAALENVICQYQPEAVGIATTCLSETIGDDTAMFLENFKKKHPEYKDIKFILTSTPSYSGTHADGFQNALRSAVEAMAEGGEKESFVNLFSGLLSASDIRHLKEILSDFGLDYTLLPDYSDTLDGPNWQEYQKVPKGGTPLAFIRRMGRASGSLELGRTLPGRKTAASYLEEKFGVKRVNLGIPIGMDECDAFFLELEKISRRKIPEKYAMERGRLIDSYIDGHKVVFEKKAVVFGDADFVIGMASFLDEVGIIPAICATGASENGYESALKAVLNNTVEAVRVIENADHMTILESMKDIESDFLIGSSKGYSLSRLLNVPLVRAGFPIHDRFGAQRLHHVGYRGTQELYDRIVNTILAGKQESSPVGYSYL